MVRVDRSIFLSSVVSSYCIWHDLRQKRTSPDTFPFHIIHNLPHRLHLVFLLMMNDDDENDDDAGDDRLFNEIRLI